MKKLISCIAVLAMMTSMTACGSDDGSSVSRADKKATEASTSETSEAETKAEETSKKETKAEKEDKPQTETKEKTKEETESETEEAEESVDTETLSREAVMRMDNVTTLLGMFAGMVTVDESDTIESDGKTYTRAVSVSGYESIEGIKGFIDENCTGSLKDFLYDNTDGCFIEKDGVLYSNSPARGYYIFRTGSGVKLSDVSENSFTASTVESDQMYGTGSAHFVYENGSWLMDSYDFD